MTAALRPWTLDFHVAQNDATVFGSGSHDHTGRHCLATDPNGKLNIPHHAGFWLRDESGQLTKKFRHICWDGCMFPNDVMMKPQTWNDILAAMITVRDAHGWRNERSAVTAGCTMRQCRILNQRSIVNHDQETSEYRPDRLRLHGPDALECVQAGQRLLRPRIPPVLKAVCGRTPPAPRRSPTKWGYESVETDWRKLVERKDIDAIDICTPNNTHAEIAIAAAEAGKMVLCEKPLAMNLVEGQKMVDAVEKAGVPNTVWYNYRRVPAVTLAKRLIDEGRLGRIFHYRANFLQDWTISADLPQGGTGLWRLDVAAAGSGVTGDLLAHCIDTALWLNGHITPSAP